VPKVCILPTLSEYGNRTWGGVLRCVEALYKYAPIYNWDATENPDDADVVHTLGMKEHPKSRIYTCLGFWENPEERYKKAQAKIERLAQQAEVFTVLSQWSKEFFDNKLSTNAEIIPNGADYIAMQKAQGAFSPRLDQCFDSYNPLRPSNRLILWAKAGLYYPNCNYGPIPVIELARANPDVRFILTVAPDIKLSPNVKVTGRLNYDIMLQEIAACDVYISTVKETFGAQTIEAMAMGKPVLAYNFGGNSEILTHKVDGYLVNPGDSLLEGAEYILEHYDNMSKRAKITAMKYDWKSKIVPKYVQLWERILNA